MRRVVICLLALVLGLPASGRCQDVQKCRDEAGSCKKCDATRTAALNEARIDRVQEAAKHLQAAGMETEARQLLTQVESLRRDLLAMKLAELDRLQVEVDQLSRSAGKPRQLKIRLQVVDISLTNMKKSGLALPPGETPQGSAVVASQDDAPNSNAVPTVGVQLCDRTTMAQFLKDSKNAGFLQIVSEPTLVALDRQPVSFSNGFEVPLPTGGDDPQQLAYRKIGTEVDAVATLLGGDRVQLKIHPRLSTIMYSGRKPEHGVNLPDLQVREVDAGCEMTLGQTVVIGGSVSQRVEKTMVGSTEKTVRNEVQTLFLVTPELLGGAPDAGAKSTAKAPSTTKQR